MWFSRRVWQRANLLPSGFRAEDGFVRRALIGATVAIFGIGAALGLGYSAGATPVGKHQVRTLAKALKKCKKDRATSKRKKCEKTARARYKSKTKRP